MPHDLKIALDDLQATCEARVDAAYWAGLFHGVVIGAVFCLTGTAVFLYALGG